MISLMGRPAKRVTVGGKKLTLWECYERYGVTPDTIKNRLRSGWSEERAATTPVKPRQEYGAHARPEYHVWRQMIYRCTKPNDPRWPRYGGRGIQVCERWRESFWAFVEDMGPRPSAKHSIDRIDGDGHYEPGNCRWVTPSEQSWNRKSTTFLTYRGESLPVKEWARRTGISRQTIRARLDRGWSVERALSEPARMTNRPLQVGRARARKRRITIMRRLRDEEGLSAAQIAAKMGGGLTEGTVNHLLVEEDACSKTNSKDCSTS